MATEQSKFGASAAGELQRNDMVNAGNGVLTNPCVMTALADRFLLELAYYLKSILPLQALSKLQKTAKKVAEEATLPEDP